MIIQNTGYMLICGKVLYFSIDAFFLLLTNIFVELQISSNTAAIARAGKRTQRFVARTVTSPSTPIPPHIIMSHQSGSAPVPALLGEAVSNAGQLDEESLEEGAEDNSFETVAEALRLQWSVIGEDNNKLVTTRKHHCNTQDMPMPALLPVPASNHERMALLTVPDLKLNLRLSGTSSRRTHFLIPLSHQNLVSYLTLRKVRVEV